MSLPAHRFIWDRPRTVSCDFHSSYEEASLRRRRTGGFGGVAVVTASFGSQRAFPSWAILVFPLDPKAEGTPIVEMSELTHGVQMVQPVSDRSPRTHSEAF